MPCTACGSAPYTKFNQLNKPKPRPRYVTPQQAAAIRAYYAACARRRRTLLF
jgi:hypothetical protein